MEKKHISIIGSCCSRELFNTSTLSEIFEVDKYAYKVCAWDLFNENKFSFDRETYKSLPIPEFRSRMIWYDLNKVTLSEITPEHSEYLMIDLLNIFYNIDEVTYNNKTVYVQEIHDRLSLYKTQILQNDVLKNISWKRTKFEDFDKQKIIDGLKKLAEWAKENFDENKIIIHIPYPAQKYINYNHEILSFEEPYISDLNASCKIVEEYSNILHSFLPNSLIMKNLPNKLSAYGPYDYKLERPSALHYSFYDYHRQSMSLLKLLNINEPLINNYPSFIWDDLKKNNLYWQQANELDYLKKLKINFYNLTLNNYFDYIEDLNDVIIIISAKDEASKFINNLFYKKFFEYKLSQHDSFIAILDKSRNFIYEQKSIDKLTYDYTIDDKIIHIESAGWHAGNICSIKQNWINIELSKQHRGLNIVLLNSKTLEIIDSAYCDSWEDENLCVHSDYFENIKINIKKD